MTITTTRGRIATLLITLITATLATAALAAPAQAAAYRYWSYWQGETGTWVAAQTGPADHQLVDQDVQGWRFGITSDAPALTPDNSADFAALCPDLAAAGATAAELRVAVVIDSGFVADAPTGQTPPADVVTCVSVPEGSTGNQALAKAAAVIDQGGLICSVNGYPQDECGTEISDADAVAAATAGQAEAANPAVIGAADTAEAADTDTSSDSASWLPFALGSAVLLVLLALAVLIPRRRQAAQTEH